MNLDLIVELALSARTVVSAESPDHGPRHWRDVARIGHALWAEGVDCDAELVFLFALFHDSQRLNEYEDPEHGERAAEVARSIVGPADIGQDRLDTLTQAIFLHDKGGATNDPTIAACWDADRLTLSRVGKVPELRYFNTDPVTAQFEDYRAFGAWTVSGPDESWEPIARAVKRNDPLDVLVNMLAGDKWKRANNAAYASLRRHLRGGELCDELEAKLTKTRYGMDWIMHPLVHTMFFPEQAAHYNDMLKAKRTALVEYRNERKWHSYVFMHERPYRFQIFLEIEGEVEYDGEHVYWELLSSVWTDSENLWQNGPEWVKQLTDAPYAALCDDEERTKLDAMPDELEIYRGTAAPDGLGCGMSWTLSQRRAGWFAWRLVMDDVHDRPRVLVGKVAKAKVKGYLTGRGEKEIVAMPDDVEVVRSYTPRRVTKTRSEEVA